MRSFLPSHLGQGNFDVYDLQSDLTGMDPPVLVASNSKGAHLSLAIWIDNFVVCFFFVCFFVLFLCFSVFFVFFAGNYP